MINVLVIDNYDSFVYNLAQYLGELGAKCTVVRNDAVTVQGIADAAYDAIVISPGPGTPENTRDFGICTDVILQLGPTTPILGVCLGHQGIIHAFGGKVVNASCVRHGKTSMVRYGAAAAAAAAAGNSQGSSDNSDGRINDENAADFGDSTGNAAAGAVPFTDQCAGSDMTGADSELFAGVSNPFSATRYHSLVGDKTVIPDVLDITARSEDDGEIMGIRHKKYPIQGVQFHPESIMTDQGKIILSNFLKFASENSILHKSDKPKERAQ